MPKRPEMMLWLSDARGVYIPRDFATSFADRAKHVSGVTDEDWSILEQGPYSASNESYWDVWNDVCDSATVTDDDGNVFRVWHQDGDCWLVPVDMEWNEETECFDWPDERQTEENA